MLRFCLGLKIMLLRKKNKPDLLAKIILDGFIRRFCLLHCFAILQYFCANLKLKWVPVLIIDNTKNYVKNHR